MLAAHQGRRSHLLGIKIGACFLLGQVIGFVKKNKNLCYKDLARFLRYDLFLAAYFLISSPLFLAAYFWCSISPIISIPYSINVQLLAASFWYLVSLINTRIT